MTDGFKKLMRKQVQESLNDFLMLAQKPIPPKGWIRTIRDALGMSSSVLAKRLNCNRANVTLMEQREKKGSISLETLEQVAKALDCKLIYCLVPIESLDKTLEKQARLVARKRVKAINHSMKLEQQGLNQKQLQQQEDDLVKELLQSDPKNLWNNDEV
ncbi:MAG TPA: mobile mystery protein A [Candidatus Babeliales bacterium]|nr:mobile mystery protein A [Candidatus Babeliales bacterium]